MGIRRSHLAFVALLAAIAGMAVLNRQRPPAVADRLETLPRLPPVPTPTAGPPADRRPPQPLEVAAALARAFGDALPAEAARTASAVAGDFNGDGSPDLAVPARPFRERLGVINGELANWVVQDPSTPALGPEPHPSPAPVAVTEDDALLAVVHGYGPSGWRSPEARQAYLLKVRLNGRVGVGSRASLVAEGGDRRRLPFLRGDVITEAGGRRFLYWTGARYRWHGAASGG